MTFRGQIDVLVHFESFRNVDLYHQGMYFLKSTLYHKQEQKVSKVFQLLDIAQRKRLREI